MTPAREHVPTPTADTPSRSRLEAPPGRALTPQDLWVGVATRAQGIAADYGAAFDQQWLARKGDPGPLRAAQLAVRRTLGLPDDSNQGVTQAALDDPRSADELAVAYLAEYAAARGIAASDVTAECPWCGASVPECVGASDAAWRWFVCGSCSPQRAWHAPRPQEVP